MRNAFPAISLLVPLAGPVGAGPDDGAIVDLTHPFNEDTVYWPTAPAGFELEVLSHGQTEGGWFYSANTFASPEHGGTHIDAPIHFFAGRDTVDAIPLERLVGPAVVIDVSQQAAADPDYRLSADDVLAFEDKHGRIAPGTIVLLRTGWSEYWPDAKRYLGNHALGNDGRGDASNLHFPGFGADSAELLVIKRQVAMIGVDTASTDYGQSREFRVHRIAAEHNVPGLENLAGLDRLPPTGARIIALPMKIAGGSGAPVRVIAILPRAD